MRFDDRLDTILMIDPAHPAGRDALWTQLVDLLAQSGQALSPQSARRGLAALAMLRARVPLATRAASAGSVAARCRFAPLVVFLGNDAPAVVIALFDRLHLDDILWDIVIPDIGPLARSRLRRRSDLSTAVRRRLDSFGATDFALPAAVGAATATPQAMETRAPVAPTPSGSSSIADLVQRIEAYRNRPAANDSGSAPSPTLADDGETMEEAARFRSDAEGNLRSVAGLPRGVFVGLSLAQAARPVESGVDAGVARAFAKRQGISGGRLLLVDAGPWSGHWLIDAVPLFDRESGCFLGYEGSIDHGQAPLSEPAETAAPQPRSDGMRQMIHELRSPLNAISGFAQLIEGQYFGPVSDRYRQLAGSIMADAAYLSTAFEDIDIAARLDTGTTVPGDGISDAAAMIATLAESHNLPYDGPQAAVPVALADRDLHQLLSRFIAVVGSGDGTAPAVRLSTDGANDFVTIAATSDSDGDSADGGALGSAFSWRLIDRMARSHGGTLRTVDGKALLNLPCARKVEGRFGAGT